MSDDAAVWAIKAARKAAGLEPALFARGSSDFMTPASQTGATLPKMIEASRHRLVNSAMGYIRDRDAFRDHTERLNPHTLGRVHLAMEHRRR